MKVYMVTSGEHDEYTEGIFSTREKAEAFVGGGRYEIQEWELDFCQGSPTNTKCVQVEEEVAEGPYAGLKRTVWKGEREVAHVKPTTREG